MTLREEITNKVLSSSKRHFVLELPTSFGKSALALKKVEQLYHPGIRILLVIPRNVLIQNWIEEFHKWGYDDMLSSVTFVTYRSLHKMAGRWDIGVFDEAHHLSERCRESLHDFHISHILFLSATLAREHKEYIEDTWGRQVSFIRVSTKRAIDQEVLPDPKILLMPLLLGNAKCNYYHKKAWKKMNNLPRVPYKDKWAWLTSKKPHILVCDEAQYYREISQKVEWYKGKNYNPVMKNLWLQKAGERLQWLASRKTLCIKSIIRRLPQDARSITFCATIDQSKALDMPRVDSEVGTDNLVLFNKKKVDHISCVNMLDEGFNPVDCQVGIFQMINASLRMQCQKLGRILRHRNPVIIIPYYIGTREAEIVRKISEEYEGMVYKLRSISQLEEFFYASESEVNKV